jgi:hypothetical protein
MLFILGAQCQGRSILPCVEFVRVLSLSATANMLGRIYSYSITSVVYTEDTLAAQLKEESGSLASDLLEL